MTVYPTTEEHTTLMIARTRKGDPVWRTDGKGRPFTLAADGQTKRNLWPLWWRWPHWPSRLRHMTEPLLSYAQVSAVLPKTSKILAALKKGPVYFDRKHSGFLKSRSNNILMSHSLALIALHWLSSCGMAFKRRELKDGRIELDIDLEKTDPSLMKGGTDK